MYAFIGYFAKATKGSVFWSNGTPAPGHTLTVFLVVALQTTDRVVREARANAILITVK